MESSLAACLRRLVEEAEQELQSLRPLPLNNKTMATIEAPNGLAEKVVKMLGDADYDTAHTALRIAELLLQHRHTALMNFEIDCIKARSSSRGSHESPE